MDAVLKVISGTGSPQSNLVFPYDVLLFSLDFVTIRDGSSAAWSRRQHETTTRVSTDASPYRFALYMKVDPPARMSIRRVRTCITASFHRGTPCVELRCTQQVVVLSLYFCRMVCSSSAEKLSAHTGWCINPFAQTGTSSNPLGPRESDQNREYTFGVVKTALRAARAPRSKGRVMLLAPVPCDSLHCSSDTTMYHTIPPIAHYVAVRCNRHVFIAKFSLASVLIIEGLTCSVFVFTLACSVFLCALACSIPS